MGKETASLTRKIPVIETLYRGHTGQKQIYVPLTLADEQNCFRPSKQSI